MKHLPKFALLVMLSTGCASFNIQQPSEQEEPSQPKSAISTPSERSLLALHSPRFASESFSGLSPAGVQRGFPGSVRTNDSSKRLARAPTIALVAVGIFAAAVIYLTTRDEVPIPLTSPGR